MSNSPKAPTIPSITVSDYQWDSKICDLVPVDHKVEFFTRDGQLYCCDCVVVRHEDLEDGGLFPEGIHPDLVNYAEQNGTYWEWQNSECIVLCGK